MNKQERTKQINEEIIKITKVREDLRACLNSLKIELDYIRGHYDKSWEQQYGK